MVGVRSQEFASRGSIWGLECIHSQHTLFPLFCSHFSFADGFCLFLSLQLFTIVVWNFELYMIPLALLLPLAWNYILIASGKDTRQDVV